MFHTTIELPCDVNADVRVLFAFPDKHEPIQRQRRTICFLSLDKQPFTMAMAKVNKKCGDVFNKKAGRKHALENALQTAGFTKEQRTAIWEKFLEKYGVN